MTLHADPESPAEPLAVAAPPPTTKRRVSPPAHVVADIRYGPENGPSWSVCSCGKTFTADDPDTMARAYATHVGKPYGGPVGYVSTRSVPQVSVSTCRVAGCEVRAERCVLRGALQ